MTEKLFEIKGYLVSSVAAPITDRRSFHCCKKCELCYFSSTHPVIITVTQAVKN